MRNTSLDKPTFGDPSEFAAAWRGEEKTATPDASETTGAETTGKVFARKDSGSTRNEENVGIATSVIVSLPLADIDLREGNPRKTFDAEALDELSASLKARGLLEPIVVRPKSAEYRTANPNGPGYELIMGERRCRAALMAGWTKISAIIRMVSDKDAFADAITENELREDLNAIELAMAYAQMVEHGDKQSEIAERMGCSPAKINNILRLNLLPAEVKQLMLEGKLTLAHGRAILRFQGFDKMMVKIATLAVAEGANTKKLEKGVPFERELKDANIIQPLQSWNQKFDISVCQKCPFQAYRKGEGYGNDLCLKPDHYKQLVKEAAAAAEVRKQEAVAALKAMTAPLMATPLVIVPETLSAQSNEELAPASMDGQSVYQPIEKDMAPIGTIADAETFVKDTIPHNGTSISNSNSIPSAPVLPHLKDVPSDIYETIWPSSCPPECTEACACRAKGVNTRNEIVPICTNPKRYKKFLTAKQEADKKQALANAKEMARSLEEAMEALRHYSGANSEGVRRAAAIICRKALYQIPPEDLKPLAERWKMVLDFSDYRQYGGELEAAFYSSLARYNAITMMLFVAEAVMNNDSKFSYQSNKSIPWFLSDKEIPLMIEGEIREGAEAALVPSPISTAQDTSLDNDDPIIDDNSEDDDQRCARCGDTVPDPEGDVRTGEHGEMRTSSGELYIPHLQAVYCASCGPSVKICPECGFTQETFGIPETTFTDSGYCTNCAQESTNCAPSAELVSEPINDGELTSEPFDDGEATDLVIGADPRPKCLNCGKAEIVAYSMCQACNDLYEHVKQELNADPLSNDAISKAVCNL